jgi:hypothetical protein
MKKCAQLAMYCRCGNEKMLALGLCSTCYTLKRQDEEYFGGFARLCWNGTATAAESAERREDLSDPLLSITEGRAFLLCT